MFEYRFELEPDDNGTIMLTIPDVPEAVTFGDTEEDALLHGRDALETALIGYMADRRDIPAPSEGAGRRVAPGLLASLKLTLYVAMRARGWRKADLAREMKLDPRQVDRLLDLRHGSSLAQLEHALHMCGGRAKVAYVSEPLEALAVVA